MNYSIEAGARAIYESMGYEAWTWDELVYPIRDAYIAAFIAGLRAAENARMIDNTGDYLYTVEEAVKQAIHNTIPA